MSVAAVLRAIFPRSARVGTPLPARSLSELEISRANLRVHRHEVSSKWRCAVLWREQSRSMHDVRLVDETSTWARLFAIQNCGDVLWWAQTRIESFTRPGYSPEESRLPGGKSGNSYCWWNCPNEIALIISCPGFGCLSIFDIISYIIKIEPKKEGEEGKQLVIKAVMKE